MNQDEENLCKLVLLIVNIAMNVIRQIISCKLLKSEENFIFYLKSNMHMLFHAWHNSKKCCKCSNDENNNSESMLTGDQFRLMFNTGMQMNKEHTHVKNNKIYCFNKISVREDASLENLDLTLANCLLICTCTPERVKDNVERSSILDWTKNIKDSRNEIFHLANSKCLPTEEFKRKWTKIEGAVYGLARLVGSQYSDQIKEELKTLKAKNVTNCQNELKEILIQCKQDINLLIHQQYEKSFNDKFKRVGINKLKDIRQQWTTIHKREQICAKAGGIKINIVDTSYIKEDVVKENKSVEVLLRVQTPEEWDEDIIIESIRRMCDEINKGGNIIIKETTLEQFMLVVEMLIDTLKTQQNLKDEIEMFFRKIFEQCNIDTSQSDTVYVSIESITEIQSPVPSDVELVLMKNLAVQKRKDAFFTSCAVWSDNHYIFIDSNNMCLIVSNHKTGDTEEIELRNKPFSMAIIDSNNVAISFPEKQEIAILNLSAIGKHGPTKFKKVNGKCYTLTKYDDNTLLVYIQGKGIHSYDMSKDEFKSLNIQIPSFVPHSDEICAQNNRLFHTNRSSGSVFCYEINGSMLWKFERDLKRPTALTSDTFGNVYVTDYTSHHLYFISADGQSHKTLLSRKDKLWLPTFVYFCVKRNCLLIVNRDNGYAASYSIKYEK
ncbi:uncharacterized protein LOC127727012 [Mytilus californianus]|uniref:uncharacterized protein LOC127727012 n=1 Tax=Mytilus californianus TaxID=6549 RepID=UPI0022468DF5|nr:uncharacterized protein LOC127727012 [Mytilus californianus]